MKKIILLAIALSFASMSAYSAKPPKLSLKKGNQKLEKAEDVKLVIMALKLPLENRISALKKQGVHAVNVLKNLAFDESQNLQVRWRSITSLGIVAPHQSQQTLDKALSSKDWFMRNAAMVAATHGKRSWALKWANRLLDDKALVVRTSAVNTIQKLKGKESQSLLWKKLYSKENFRHGDSLWIRKHIAKTLATFAKKGQEKKFVRMLRDKDEELHPFALKGLEKSQNYTMKKGMSLTEKRSQWLAWARKYKI